MDDVAFIRPKPIVVQSVGFAQPDSALHDADADVYFVSNINGEPRKKDDNGFISRITPDGKVENLKWIDGKSGAKRLNAPKGMALLGDRLYVADIDAIRIFHRKTGAALGTIHVPGAKYLNAISAAPNGTLYISDTGLEEKDGKLEPGKKAAVRTLSKWGNLKTLAKGEDLNQPNGLAGDDTGVWVASWGKAELYRLTKYGKREDPVKAPSDMLDGIVRMPDGALLLSSWKTQSVYIGHPGTEFALVADHAASPAGIGYDDKRRRVLIPLTTQDTFVIQELSGFEETAGATSDE